MLQNFVLFYSKFCAISFITWYIYCTNWHKHSVFDTSFAIFLPWWLNRRAFHSSKDLGIVSCVTSSFLWLSAHQRRKKTQYFEAYFKGRMWIATLYRNGLFYINNKWTVSSENSKKNKTPSYFGVCIHHSVLWRSFYQDRNMLNDILLQTNKRLSCCLLTRCWLV